METISTLNIVKRFILALVFLMLGLVSVFGQNLVINPSFEDFSNCPQEYGTFQDDVNSWYKPTKGSTDYFNKCGGKMKAGLNFIGEQKSFHGDAYAGFYAYGPNGYREYVTGKLSENLVKGQKYTFSFKVSLAEKSQFAVNELGILFSQMNLELDTKRNISSHSMQKRGLANFTAIRNPNCFADKNGWMNVSGEYIAHGDEKYFTIGNFRSNPQTRVAKVASNLKRASYYYIDMVVVEDAQKSFQLDETYVLENLFFEVNGYEIIGDGRKELQKIVKHLQSNPDLNISIYGHTDNVGSSSHNKELSQKRAQEVGLFLLENGLSTSRIAWKGFGDMLPVAANETDEGRKKNRRVEFVVSKKGRDFYASGVFEEDY